MTAGDLTTLENVKGWLDLSGNEHDDLLNRLVTACSAFVVSWLSIGILHTTYTDKRTGHGGKAMTMANFPLLAVTSLTVDGVVIPAAPNSQCPGYTFDDNTIYLNGYSFSRNKNNVLVTYEAGFDMVPFDIEQAVVETVGLRFKEKKRIGKTSEGLSGQTTSFKLDAFSDSAKQILFQYKKQIPL